MVRVMKIIDPTHFKELNDFYSQYSHLRKDNIQRLGSEPVQTEVQKPEVEKEEIKSDNDQGADEAGAGEIAIQAPNTVNEESISEGAINQCLEGWIPVDSTYVARKVAKRRQYRHNRQLAKKKKNKRRIQEKGKIEKTKVDISPAKLIEVHYVCPLHFIQKRKR